MSTPAVLDLPRLLEPISADRPVGVDLREDSSPRSTYYSIRDARNQARTAERQAQMNGESPIGAGDWSPLINGVPDILAGMTKDLEITAYLVEALARNKGFAGLRDGFHLLRELVSRYGDDIYPLPDEDGIETRVAALTGLNGADGEGTLINPIRNISLTERAAGEYGSASYEQALDIEHASPEQRDRRIAQGAVSLTVLQTAINDTSTEFLLQVWDDLKECLAEYDLYEKAVDEKYGRDSPPTSNIRSALNTCRDVLTTLAGDRIKGATPAAAPEATAADNAAAPKKVVAATGGFGPIQTREEAFKQLQEIAQYFRKTEPHTPITFAIEQVVRWGKMPLPDLLRELIPDPSSVQQMFRLVGIPPNPQQ